MRRAAQQLLACNARISSTAAAEGLFGNKGPAAVAAQACSSSSSSLRALPGGGLNALRGQQAQTWRGQQTKPETWQDANGYQHFKERVPWYQGKAGWIVGGGAAAFAAYYVACMERVPYTNRRHSIMFVSRTSEKALGKMVFDMHRADAQREGRLLPDNHPSARLVRNVGTRLAAVASDDSDPEVDASAIQHMKGLEWEFAVIKNSVPNAYVVPGGKVVVFTGLLHLLSSEDELAAVLAHETSHVLARHHAERMSTMNVLALARLFMYALFGFSVPQSMLLLGIFLPYSRLAEYEADEIGLRVMSRACYDPAAMKSMLAKLHAKEHEMESRGMSIPQLLRTHPLTDDRVTRVGKQLPDAYRVYEAKCGAIRGVFESTPSAFPLPF